MELVWIMELVGLINEVQVDVFKSEMEARIFGLWINLEIEWNQFELVIKHNTYLFT